MRSHDFPRSESTVTARGPEVHVRLALDLLELGGVDANGDGAVSYTELDANLERVYALVTQHFVVTADVPPVRKSAERSVVVNDHVLQMDLVFVFASDVSAVTIRSSFQDVMRPDHQHATRVSIAGATESATLNAVTPQATFAAGGSRAMWRFARLGMDQVFARYDGLALLAVLLVAASTIDMLVAMMVPFTLAHAVALGLATSGIVVLSVRVALGLIAFGILWVAAESLAGVRAVDCRLTAGIVGLFYGFRCSTMLSAQFVPRPVLPLASASYWLGMNVGQLAVAAVLIPLVALLQRAFVNPSKP
jgi:HupE/UreJ protein